MESGTTDSLSDIFDHAALANFEEWKEISDSAPLINRQIHLRQDDSPMSEEEYKDWFFKTFEMSKEEYEEIVVKKVTKTFPGSRF